MSKFTVEKLEDYIDRKAATILLDMEQQGLLKGVSGNVKMTHLGN